MNIDKALSHFKYKLTNSWKPTPTDIKAYNAILDYKEQQESHVLSQNESLAKLFIHQFILMCSTNLYTSEMALKSIDDILSKSVYDWTMTLKEQIPMMKFNSIGITKYPLETKDMLNMTLMQERSAKIIEEYPEELTEAINTEVKEDQICKWVAFEVNRIINKFDK
ncbi:hypothetical protein Harreka1_58 [Olleya phage Harreka_1]|uniref:Uncharacterized protein n=1 Tax=Olleya phage Harreka_1 TaxID=2745673 RepID=A0A8E4ZER4_9CAUD|nr:hypothetical protein M1M26_gp58 [Olleya phage Harreka_1]QQV90465.1 hypothetical protein Harreka1_58 [Olleya phage Harreka_1]